MTCVTASVKESLKNHILEQVLDSEKFKAFYLKDPAQGRQMSTLLTFTPEGIVIMGDFCPGGPRNEGVISSFGYDLGWFASEKSEDYLCGKFLKQEWNCQSALAWLVENKKDILAEPEVSKDVLEDVEAYLSAGDMLEGDFMAEMEEAGYDISDDAPGYDYDPHTAAVLCGLQQKFSELYLKKGEKKS